MLKNKERINQNIWSKDARSERIYLASSRRKGSPDSKKFGNKKQGVHQVFNF
jgi:hypothetical protein